MLLNMLITKCEREKKASLTSAGSGSANQDILELSELTEMTRQSLLGLLKSTSSFLTNYVSSRKEADATAAKAIEGGETSD